MKQLSLVPQSAHLFAQSAGDVQTGELAPFFIAQVCPGEQFIVGYKANIAEAKRGFILDVDFFYVPLISLFPWFNSWMYGLSAVELPYISPNAAKWEAGSIFDLLGYPIAPTESIHPFSLAAYAAIWNEFYRLPKERERNFTLFPGENDAPGCVYCSRFLEYPDCFYPDSRPLPRNWENSFSLFTERGGIRHVGGYSALLNKPINVCGFELLFQSPAHGLVMGVCSVVTGVQIRPVQERGRLIPCDGGSDFPSMTCGSFVRREAYDRTLAVTKDWKDFVVIENNVELCRLIPKRPV